MRESPLPIRRFSRRSERELATVSPVLADVVRSALALSPVPFEVTEGRRKLSRQVYLHATGRSRTLSSRHLDGEAVDVVAIVGGAPSWDWEHYVAIASAMRDAARERGVEIVWGGDWATLRDGPHFELGRSSPPAQLPT